ncbi:MAG TPA: GNAT family N-acetyltransferase [Chitinophagaceae bacterium]|nr:GNAT family N-acetyltransferase [Chitinophagaceae bacterium]
MEIIKTKRLILKPFTTGDTEFILELLNTEGWIKNIGDRNVKTTEEAKNYLKNGPLKSYELNGFGLYLVQLNEGGTSIGMCGFVKRDYLDHPDIGFAFLPEYIGKGYAFEIATRIIEYGLMELEFEKIFAITLPQNSSSVKLIERIGFTYDKNFITNDTNEELSLYYITKERNPADK